MLANLHRYKSVIPMPRLDEDSEGGNPFSNEDDAAALEKLPLLYSEPMLLYYREGLSLRDISDALNVSPGAVKVRIHRGREKLKLLLGVDHE